MGCPGKGRPQSWPRKRGFYGNQHGNVAAGVMTMVWKRAQRMHGQAVSSSLAKLQTVGIDDNSRLSCCSDDDLSACSCGESVSECDFSDLSKSSFWQ